MWSIGYGVPGYMSKGPNKAANSGKIMIIKSTFYLLPPHNINKRSVIQKCMLCLGMWVEFSKFVVKLLWFLGYMPLTTGKGVSNRKGPKGEIVSPEEPSHLPVTSNTKGFLPPSGHEQNTGLFPEQTKGLPAVLQQTKGQNLHPQGKAPNSMVPQPAPNPFMQGPSSYKPSKAYKPPTPVIPQNKAPKPAAPVVPQGIPATESAPIPQVFSQEQNISPVVPQPITPPPSISSQATLVPESAQSTPEVQTSKIQMKNPTTNPGEPL